VRLAAPHAASLGGTADGADAGNQDIRQRDAEIDQKTENQEWRGARQQ